MWGRPMKDVQEGNPTTHDMASPVLAGGGGRFSFQVRVVVRVSQRSGVRLSSVELQVGLVKGRLGDYFGVTIILDLCFS
ncbi:hypothetical protein LINPERPRIM_LOCUS20289 [Linum perenne]